jgi:lysophospholipase L1-like esterase
VDLAVEPLAELAVSLYIPEDSGPVTLHPLGLRTTYIAEGDVTPNESLSGASENRSYFWLSGIEVLTSGDAAAVVAFGDSITDGFSTTPGAEQAWPALLAKRSLDRKRGPSRAVLNLGISGNRVLRDGAGASALARFDRDVLSRPEVRWVILLEGINDISVSSIPGVAASERIGSEDLIAGLRLFIEQAHLHAIKVMGATILPWEGVWTFSEEGERTRVAVNQWIRAAGFFDAVVDFDAVTRDSTHPQRLRPQFDSGDHVHPNDAGNRAMADAVDLRKLTR